MKSSPISITFIDIIMPVIIAGGRDAGFNSLDIIDVVDNNTNCKVNQISIPLYGASGINGMICGGEDYERTIVSSCWHLDPDGAWTAGKDMLEPKRDFSLNKVQDEIIAIGGGTTSKLPLKSIERLSLRNDDGWSRMKYAPISIGFHCTVLLNTSYLMIIGGVQNGQVNSKQ